MIKLITLLSALAFASALTALGVNQDQSGNLLAVDVSVDTSSGNLSLGVPSSPYNPGTDVCVASYNGSAFAVSDGNGLQIVNMYGTVNNVTVNVPGIVIISMCYSNTLNSDVFLGWNTSTGKKPVIHIKNINGNKYMSSDTNPQISAVNRNTGAVTVLQSDVDGGAFLKCVCTVDDNAPNNTVAFITSILNDQETDQFVMMVCVKGSCTSTQTRFSMYTKGATNTLTVDPNSHNVYSVAGMSNPQLWVVNPYNKTVHLVIDYSSNYSAAPLAAGTLSNGVHYSVLQDVNNDEFLASYNFSSGNVSYVPLPGANNLSSGLWVLNP